MTDRDRTDDSRRRRLLRRTVRIVLWTLVALAVLVGLVRWVGGSSWARERVRTLAEARISEYLGREVSIGEVGYGVAPLQVTARNVVIPGPRADEPPFAVLPAIRVELEIDGVLDPKLDVQRVDVERPTVRLVFYPDGSDNLPAIRTGDGGGEARVEVRIGRLVVDEGEVLFDERRVPLSVDAGPVRATLEGQAATPLPEGQLRFSVVAQELSALLPDAEPWGGSLSARGVIASGRVELSAGRLFGPDLSARFDGVIRFGEDGGGDGSDLAGGGAAAGAGADGDGEGGRGGEIDVVATGSLALANRLGYLDQPVAGPFEFRGQVNLGESTSYRGRLTSPRVDFLERRFADVVAALEGGAEGLTVELERAGHADGTLMATVRLAGDDGQGDGGGAAGRPVDVDARADDLALAALLADLDLGDSVLAGLRGRADAALAYRFTTDAPLDGDGGGTVRLTSAGTDRTGGDRLPVSGTVPLRVTDGVLAVREARLTAPGQRLEASGVVDLERLTGRFTYVLSIERLGRLVAALPREQGAAGGAPPFWLPTGGTGKVAGELELTGGGRYTLEAGVELAAVETEMLRLDRLSAPLQLSNGVLSTGDMVAEGEGQRLLLAGRWNLETAAGEADYRLSSSDLAPLLGPFAAQRSAGPPPPWLPAAGTGRIEGRIALSPEGDLTGRTDLDLENLALPDLTLTGLTGSFELDAGAVRDLRLEVTSDGGALVATGSFPLPPLAGAEPQPPPAGAVGEPGWTGRPFDLTVDVVDWPVATLPPFLEPAMAEGASGLPRMEGTLSGMISASGTLDDPRARLELTAIPLRVAGVELDRLVVVSRMEGSRVVVETLDVTLPAGEVRAQGEFDRDGATLDARLAATGLALGEAPFAHLLPGDVDGSLDLRLEVGGSLEQPRAELTTEVRGVRVQGRALVPPAGEGGGRTRLTATWAEDRLTLDGSLLGVLELAGGGRLTPEEADLAVRIEKAGIGELLRVVTETPPRDLEGSFAGEVTVDGRFDQPGGPDLALRLDELAASYRGHELENLEPVVARLRTVDGSPTLMVDSLYLGEPANGGEVFLTGEIELADDFSLDLRTQAELAADWLELLPADIRFDGTLRALASVGGTLADPAVDGQGEIVRGEVLLPDFPHALERVNGVVLFYPERVLLDELTARMAGGRLRAAGQVLLPTADRSLSYRFQTQATGVGVRFPEGFLLRGDANLTLSTDPDGRQIVGQVDLERAFYLEDVPVGITQLLRRVFEPGRLEAGTADPALAATQLNVAVRGPDALRVRNNVADLSGDVDLVLRGNLADPVIFGQVELDRGGEILYSDTEYRVERGLLTFANPYRIDPVIDLTATTEVRNYDITLNLAGTLDRLNASFSSDPPLADLEVVSLLTVGRPVGESEVLGGATGVGGGGGAGQAAEELLYGQAASLIAERVNQLFGFDRFRVNPVSGGTAGSSNLAFTVGQQLSRDVYVTYTRDPSTPEVDVVQVEWQAQENVVVVLTREGDGTYALDVQVERRF